jgi:hypothetical protein
MLEISEKILKDFPLPGDVLDVVLPDCPELTRWVVLELTDITEYLEKDSDHPSFLVWLLGPKRDKSVFAELDLPTQKISWRQGIKKKYIPLDPPKIIVSPLREYYKNNPDLGVVIPFTTDIITAPGVNTTNRERIPVIEKDIYKGYLQFEPKEIRKKYYKVTNGMIPDVADYKTILDSLYYMPQKAYEWIRFSDLCGCPGITGLRDPDVFL